MKILLFFTLAFLASLTSAVNITCLHNVSNNRIFDLCPFQNPINVSYDDLPHFAANMTFSLTKPNVPSCNSNSTDWFSGINNGGFCAVTTTDPTFNYYQQVDGQSGISIHYPMDFGAGELVVHLLCNKTAPILPNATVFYVDGIQETTIVIVGYSPFGCPVKAADVGRKFLDFNQF